jgi:WD40 repeat protein
VLIVGGCTPDGCTTAEDPPSTEYYVPGQGFTAGPELEQSRQGHSATLLADGRVLIVGGWAREGAPALDSAEVYRPDLGRFEPVGPLNVARGGHTEAALPDGRVIIAGGNTETAELFDPGRNEFTLAASMPEPRFAAPAIALTDGRVLVVGGRDTGDHALASAVLYDPKSDTWQPTGSMSTPRDKHTLAPLPDGRVLVLGGTPDDRELLSSTEIYDPSTGQFEPGPPMDTPRYKLTAAVDADGRVIVAGGTQTAVYDSGGFHPINGTAGLLRWSPTVTVLPNGDVLIVGGYDERIRVHDDALLISASQIAAATP